MTCPTCGYTRKWSGVTREEFNPIKKCRKCAFHDHHFYDKDGYVLFKNPNRDLPNEPRYILEHRYIMEQHLGRKLRANENIHHKNGIRHDNSLSNLELWAKHQPTGAKVTDLIEWAKDILATYESEISKLT